jgi:hypothetical protein
VQSSVHSRRIARRKPASHPGDRRGAHRAAAIAMQTHDNVQIDLSLQPVTDRDCEQIAGGEAFDGYLRNALDLLPGLICLFSGRICA